MVGESPVPRVAVLVTGGTLGMVGTPLEPGDWAARLEATVPELPKLARLDVHLLCNLDSSDVGPAIWTQLAETVARLRHEAEGFVVVHGTDTMAFSASALAMTFTNLDRPVVFTGAQRSLGAYRSDARRNLQDAVELATMDLPEVGICFDGLFLRGCRSVKADANSYRAFDSPGLAPLARLGVSVEVLPHVRRPAGPFACHAAFDERVAVTWITPAMRPIQIEALADLDLRGLVVGVLGVGTVPAWDGAMQKAFQRIADRGIDILAVTQHGGLTNLGLYRNGAALREVGALAGGRMRIEAAVPKLMRALAVFPDRAERHAWLLADVAGEQGV